MNLLSCKPVTLKIAVVCLCCYFTMVGNQERDLRLEMKKRRLTDVTRQIARLQPRSKIFSHINMSEIFHNLGDLHVNYTIHKRILNLIERRQQAYISLQRTLLQEEDEVLIEETRQRPSSIVQRPFNPPSYEQVLLQMEEERTAQQPTHASPSHASPSGEN